MRVLKMLALLLLTLLAFRVSAQKSKAIRTDTTKTSVTTIVITEHNSSNYFSNKRSAYTTAVKISPLNIINGDLPLFVERRITDIVTVEVGAGLTVQNFVPGLFDGDLQKIEPSGSSEMHEYKLGYSLQAGLRLYPAAIALEGFYFAPVIRHRVYNSMLTHLDEFQLPDPRAQQTVLTDFKFAFGQLDYFENNIFYEWFGGIGLRNRTEEKTTYERQYSSAGYSLTDISHTRETRVVPAYSVGIRLGIVF